MVLGFVSQKYDLMMLRFISFWCKNKFTYLVISQLLISCAVNMKKKIFN